MDLDMSLVGEGTPPTEGKESKSDVSDLNTTILAEPEQAVKEPEKKVAVKPKPSIKPPVKKKSTKVKADLGKYVYLDKTYQNWFIDIDPELYDYDTSRKFDYLRTAIDLMLSIPLDEQSCKQKCESLERYIAQNSDFEKLPERKDGEKNLIYRALYLLRTEDNDRNHGAPRIIEILQVDYGEEVSGGNEWSYQPVFVTCKFGMFNSFSYLASKGASLKEVGISSTSMGYETPTTILTSLSQMPRGSGERETSENNKKSREEYDKKYAKEIEATKGMSELEKWKYFDDNNIPEFKAQSADINLEYIMRGKNRIKKYLQEKNLLPELEKLTKDVEQKTETLNTSVTTNVTEADEVISKNYNIMEDIIECYNLSKDVTSESAPRIYEKYVKIKSSLPSDKKEREYILTLLKVIAKDDNIPNLKSIKSIETVLAEILKKSNLSESLPGIDLLLEDYEDTAYYKKNKNTAADVLDSEMPGGKGKSVAEYILDEIVKPDSFYAPANDERLESLDDYLSAMVFKIFYKYYEKKPSDFDSLYDDIVDNYGSETRKGTRRKESGVIYSAAHAAVDLLDKNVFSKDASVKSQVEKNYDALINKYDIDFE